MNHSYEIEIKSLLGSKNKAEELKQKMKFADSGLVEVGSHKQLNHYFVDGDLQLLHKNVAELVEAGQKDRLKDLSARAKDFSVRTRWADGKVILVVKASVDDTSSSNGTARLEWESRVQIPIEELDRLVLGSRFSYQAKWSRERHEYLFHPSGREINVSIDKNAGYGYLAEFEVVVGDPDKTEEVKSFIRETMRQLEVVELPQDRLARMFDYYNQHWEEYYGTDKIFTIK